jgi:hypothetical protein
MNSRIPQRDNKSIVTALYMAMVLSMQMVIYYGAGRDGYWMYRHLGRLDLKTWAGLGLAPITM